MKWCTYPLLSQPCKTKRFMHLFAPLVLASILHPGAAEGQATVPRRPSHDLAPRVAAGTGMGLETGAAP